METFEGDSESPVGVAEMAVVCAWCKVMIQPGEGPMSHGMCGDCGAKITAEMDDLAADPM